MSTLQSKTQSLSHLIRVRGLRFYLVRHCLRLNRPGMGHVAAQFLPERLCVVRINLRVIWRDRTKYAKESDYVFPSVKLRGKKPLSGSIMVRKYFRPAAISAGRHFCGLERAIRFSQFPAFAGFLAGEAEV